MTWYFINRLFIIGDFLISLICEFIQVLFAYFTNRKEREINSVLVIQVFDFGDIILTIPVFQNVKMFDSRIKTSFICGYWGKELVSLLSEVDNIIVYNSPVARSSGGAFKFKNSINVIRSIIALKPDIIYNARGDLFTSLGIFFLLLLRPRTRVYNRVSVTIRELFKKQYLHQVEKNLMLVKLSGIPVKRDKLEVDISITYNVRFEDYGELFDYIVFHLGANFKYRLWPPGYTIHFLRKITDEFKQLKIVLTGSKKDITNEFVSQVINEPSIKTNKKIVNLIGKTTIPELIAVIKKAKLFIGPDTGILHLAVGLGVPTIGLYGPDTPHKVGPYKSNANKYVFYKKLSCSPCKQIKCKRPDNYCIMQISPEEVFSVCKILLGENKNI